MIHWQDKPKHISYPKKLLDNCKIPKMELYWNNSNVNVKSSLLPKPKENNETNSWTHLEQATEA